MTSGGLVLSIFPGLGLLDRAFEAEGFTVVRGPDPIWGGDVRDFHPPSGVFEGVIGGDPCQSHSALSNLVRAKGLEPSFPDMTEDFARIVAEAEPVWFLRENVPQAPGLWVEGYGINTFLLDNASLLAEDGLGQEQTRKRRFWFGRRLDSHERITCDLRRFMDFAAFELPSARATCGDARSVPVRLGGGSGKVKRAAVGSGHDSSPSGFPRARTQRGAATGRHTSNGMGSAKPGNPPRYTVAEMLELQGLPPDYLKHCPLTIQGKRKAIGNGVPQAMGRALARAVRGALAASGAR